MPRALRTSKGGLVYHVLNRGNGRSLIFRGSGDYDAFERVLTEGCRRVAMRLLSYCVMPNHWHLVLWPRKDDDLSSCLAWLTMTHAQRWHAHRRTVGSGHLYQGRFKSFVIQADPHFLTVCRYVERNALRAGLVERADDWRWSSLWRRERGDARAKALLSPWPIDPPANWLRTVNRPQTEKQVAAIRLCIGRNRPYGDPQWLERIVPRLGLESTFRPRGRPQKNKEYKTKAPALCFH